MILTESKGHTSYRPISNNDLTVTPCANSIKDNRIMQMWAVLSFMAGPTSYRSSSSTRRDAQLSNEDKIS